jgi:hypothetical protein
MFADSHSKRYKNYNLGEMIFRYTLMTNWSPKQFIRICSCLCKIHRTVKARRYRITSEPLISPLITERQLWATRV